MKLEELKRIASKRNDYGVDDEVMMTNSMSDFLDMADKNWDKLIAVVDAIKSMRDECLKEGNWYLGIGCEFAERVDAALKDLEQE